MTSKFSREVPDLDFSSPDVVQQLPHELWMQPTALSPSWASPPLDLTCAGRAVSDASLPLTSQGLPSVLLLQAPQFTGLSPSPASLLVMDYQVRASFRVASLGDLFRVSNGMPDLVTGAGAKKLWSLPSRSMSPGDVALEVGGDARAWVCDGSGWCELSRQWQLALGLVALWSPLGMVADLLWGTGHPSVSTQSFTVCDPASAWVHTLRSLVPALEAHRDALTSVVWRQQLSASRVPFADDDLLGDVTRGLIDPLSDRLADGKGLMMGGGFSSEVAVLSASPTDPGVSLGLGLRPPVPGESVPSLGAPRDRWYRLQSPGALMSMLPGLRGHTSLAPRL